MLLYEHLLSSTSSSVKVNNSFYNCHHHNYDNQICNEIISIDAVGCLQKTESIIVISINNDYSTTSSSSSSNSGADILNNNEINNTHRFYL